MREEEFEIGGRYASKFTKLSSRNQKTSPQRREDSHRQAPWHGRDARTTLESWHGPGLSLRMVGGADQGPCFHVTETQGKRVLAQIRKLSRRVVTVHRKMIPRRLEVLAQRQYVNVVLPQVVHHFEDLVAPFPESYHHAGFGVHAEGLGMLQVPQRTRVAGTGTSDRVKPGHRFHVVGEHIGPGLD